MGPRQRDNEATLKRHVWRHDAKDHVYYCSCHGLRISMTLAFKADRFFFEAHAHITMWNKLDLIVNMYENGVTEEWIYKKTNA